MFYVKCVPLPELKKYELVESTIIEGYEVIAPYRWNGASIPDFLWPIIGSPFDPRYMAPSLIHDHGYEYGTLPREDLDKLFKKLLIHNNVSEAKAWSMYVGVRKFGRPFYNDKGRLGDQR